MRCGWLLVAFVALAFAGCTSSSTLPTTSPTPDQVGPPSSEFLAEGAESSSSWRARTFLFIGTDNRPGVGEWHTTTKHAHNGTKSWTFQDESVGRYHDAASYDLHAGETDLKSAKKPVLEFYYRGESEVRSGDEFSWMFGRGDGTYRAFGSTDAPAKEWKQVRVDVSAYAGKSLDLLFRFEADACGGDTPASAACGAGTFEGYFLDDVRIYESG